MNLMPLAFLMGFLGSVHCAVMCGPIVLGLPLNKKGSWRNVLQVLLYQLGRISIYALLGLLVGLVGNTFAVFAKQETLSLIIGIVLILFTFAQLSGRYLPTFQKLQNNMVVPISKLMGKVFKLPFWGFFAGMLNGLIPCGMVYLALATALNSASSQSGAMFMLLFGLGTSPLMIFISLGGIYLKKYLKFNSQRFVPWFALFIGALFILRSANLNIPFLSPHTYSTYGSAVNCE
ncbi:sulfite exporter TauE/SafE family protein [Pedobacter sp. SL55]|uniref:sulfite exporter TauE/SafE family protein n=1 Tax=Pedobacter sp. SL55 TaxID=2995161 RepID=UPI00226DE27A|nr:sulfite exporter TauE/SafE family protein [Pedobacter sp. SL55]WAC39908.1 sulfite exporter TauE/SafE family protein [Pedobacter sp. SL55]